MPANRFEKQVREQLDDLQLNPSAAVWQRVEEQIRKKRKRRIIIFFLLPLGLGLLSFFAVNFLSKGDSPLVANAPATRQSPDNRGNSRFSPASSDQVPSSQPVIDHANTNPQQQAPGQITNIDDPLSNGNSRLLPEAGHEMVKQGKNLKTQNSIQKKGAGHPEEKAAATENATIEKKEREVKEHEGRREELTPGKDYRKIQEGNPVPAADSLKEGPAQQPASRKDTSGEKLFAVETPGREKPTPPAKRDLRFGIELSTGIASSRSNLFALPGITRSQDDFSQLPSTGSGAPAAPQQPSSISPGLSLGIGLAVEKRINDRLSVNTGLGYSYLSTRIKVGALHDTSVMVPVSNLDAFAADRIYYASGKRNYTNGFHFIHLPLQLQWKVNARLPFYWNVGGAVSYLVKTNALIYNPGLGGFYYQDPASFSKWHVGLSTGLAVSLKLAKGRELFLGPSLGFDMTNMLDRKYDRKSYLHYGGLSARLLFSKNK